MWMFRKLLALTNYFLSRNGLTNPSDQEVSLAHVLAMKNVLLGGVAALDAAEQSPFVRHVTVRNHWARNNKCKYQVLM